MSIEKIKVPDIGDAEEVEVIEVLVSVGDTVEENDSLIVLESDKAAMEIPAPMAGTVKSIAIKLGDQVTTGADILSLEVAGSAASDKAEEASEKPAKADDESKQGKAEKPAPEAAKAPAKQADKGESRVETIEIPDLGTEDEVEVIEVHVADGDSVERDAALVTLESDKAAMEVPAPKAGKIEQMLVAVGDMVKTGSPLVKMLTESAGESGNKQSAPKDSSASDKPAEPAKKQADKPVETKASKTEKAAGSDGLASVARSEESPVHQLASRGKVYAGPAVRKLARELGVDLTNLKGTGARARIIKEDVNDYVKRRMTAPEAAGPGLAVDAVPDIDFSVFGEVEEKALSKLHKITARNMHRNWATVPHVAQFNHADVTELEDFRAELKPQADKKGVKLTFLPFLLKACAKTLQEYPQFNVSLHSSGEFLIQKKYIHIGVAVATKAGLLVPVLRDVDKKSIWQLSAELAELTDKAKDRKLGREDMQGACFTISSLGAIGGSGFIPIVNAPEVAILGVGKTQVQPVYVKDELLPRKMLPLTLSYDHRAVNGVDGGLFSTFLVEILSDIRRFML